MSLKKEIYDDNIEKTDDDYETYKKIVRLAKEEKYNFKDIEVFTNTWTMEFDIALSCIKEYLYAAVLIAKDIHENEIEIESIEIDSYIEKSKEIINDMQLIYSTMEIAYQIYRPLLNKEASKAVCAQYLSKILLQEVGKDGNLLNKILEDDYLKYIIEAINHVTSIESEDKSNE